MHQSNAGNNMGVAIGGNGTGKSWLLGWVAESLGVTPSNEKTLFDVNHLDQHLFFDSQSFIAQCNKLMSFKKRTTVGYQLILDEGQLALYSKEAFNQEVKNLSRMLMTIRSRRWGVYINLPSFGMLNKDVRLITNWMVQMKGKPKEFSYGTFYNIETNMFSGEPYLKKPIFSTKEETLTGVPLIKNVAYGLLPFPKPSREFIKNYEVMKANHQKILYEKFGVIQDAINGVEEKKKQSIEEMAQEILKNPSLFLNKQKIFVKDRIRSKFGVSEGQAFKVFSLLQNASL